MVVLLRAPNMAGILDIHISMNCLSMVLYKIHNCTNISVVGPEKQIGNDNRFIHIMQLEV